MTLFQFISLVTVTLCGTLLIPLYLGLIIFICGEYEDER